MSDKLPQAICGSDDKTLKIGDAERPCYVLEDDRRVLALRSRIKALGMAYGGPRISGVLRLTSFVTSELIVGLSTPILFKTNCGITAHGYEAQVLADICEAVLAARTQGKLQKQQMHIAKQ
jgi:hypothetical protein